MDHFLDVIRNERFTKIIPTEYAKAIKTRFLANKELWYKVISPTDKANELYDSTKGDFSKIWEEHCACCFKVINKKTREKCYVSEDKFTWLCAHCYDEIFEKS